MSNVIPVAIRKEIFAAMETIFGESKSLSIELAPTPADKNGARLLKLTIKKEKAAFDKNKNAFKNRVKEILHKNADTFLAAPWFCRERKA